MAYTLKCPFCGATVLSDQKICPECGANNPNYTADQPERILQPKTIGELREYCAERGMPLLRMRFFIGEDFREPRAFGIFRDGNDFVVYKNKADGTRAVRYRGPDEAYAVNELFSKLLEECHNRSIYPDGRPGAGGTRIFADSKSIVEINHTGSRKQSRSYILLFVFLFVVVPILCAKGWDSLQKNMTAWETARNEAKNGYYLYNDTLYNYQYQRSKNSGYVDLYEYDGSGWKISGESINNLQKAQKSDSYNPEWGGAEIVFPTEFPQGYYRYQDTTYYRDTSYYMFDQGEQEWKYGKNLPYHDEEGYILFPKTYYEGKVFQAEWSGCEFTGPEGYYRYNGVTFYYHPSIAPHGSWYQSDVKGWKKSSYPVGNYNSYYIGETFDPEWGGSEIILSIDHPEHGYYRCNNTTYYYGQGNNWYYSTNSSWRSTWRFPEVFDADGYLHLCDEYYMGISFQPEWGGFAYCGYYRYDGITYYFEEDSLYQYDHGWIKGKYPITLDEFRNYYAGTSFLPEWEGNAYSKEGYYRYNGDTYYAKYNSWHIYTNGEWKSTSAPTSDYLDYYEGMWLQNDWDASWYTGSSLFSFDNNKGNDYGTWDTNQSKWDDDWDNDDYGDWDMGDTDWDSDW